MNTESNINTGTKRSKANAAMGKRAAASNAAPGCSAAATAAAAALYVQLCYCCLSGALMWCVVLIMYLHGVPKKCRCSCVGMRVFFVQRTTASHKVVLPVYVPGRYSGHRHHWNRLAMNSYLRAKSANRAK